jgi:hypothetical protein
LTSGNSIISAISAAKLKPITVSKASSSYRRIFRTQSGPDASIKVMTMTVFGSNDFLPRVNNCPRSVMTIAVARVLREPYAALLTEGLPADLLAAIQRMEASSKMRADGP